MQSLIDHPTGRHDVVSPGVPARRSPRRLRRLGTVAVATFALATVGAGTAAAETGVWEGSTAMSEARAAPSAAVLPSGRVFVAGGGASGRSLASAEILDPDTGTAVAAASLPEPRDGAAAVTLEDGRVLIPTGSKPGPEGDRTHFDALLYDEATNSYSETSEGPGFGSGCGFAVRLADGDVLIGGGFEDARPGWTEKTAIYHVDTDTWTRAADMPIGRGCAAAAALPDGRVLVAGGYSRDNQKVDDAHIYDPSTDSWTSTAPYPEHNGGLTGTSLRNGDVLVSGGEYSNRSYVYDPDGDGGAGSWTRNADLTDQRQVPASVQLPSGGVLVVGGVSFTTGRERVLATTERFRLGAAPVSEDAPEVSGSPEIGETLTATGGSWSGTPDLTFAWLRCDADGRSCASIDGADDASYEVTSADDNHRLRVQVRATNDGGQTTALSALTDAVISAAPVNTGLPTISGTAKVGSTLSATPGTWSTPVSVAYSWLRCDSAGRTCKAVSGETASTYELTRADDRARMRVKVLATNRRGSRSAQSNATGGVVADAPTNTQAPVVSGTPQVGSVLTTTDGQWTGDPALTFSWARCDSAGRNCQTIAGADGRSYTLKSADDGSRIRSSVTATTSGGSKRVLSNATSTVKFPAPVNTEAPVLSGVAKRGETLSTTSGAWENSPTLTYAWLRCDSNGRNCQTIADANGMTYDPVDADLGYRLRAEVTAVNSGGTKKVKTNASKTVLGR